MSEEPVGLYRASSPDLPYGEFLLTVWPDGTIEMSYRMEERHSWGPPVQFEPRSVR